MFHALDVEWAEAIICLSLLSFIATHIFFFFLINIKTQFCDVWRFVRRAP